MNDLFNDMQLPFANSNEELETISNNAFKPLFDISRFEIRAEIEKDKGIDFHIELKLKRPDNRSVHTNFRFAIQLKATEHIVKNSDGSFSKQIELSNVNYLLNTGMPAYYVFYHIPSGTFYYENVNDFFTEIHNKEKAEIQQTYTLRFSKQLNNEAIEKIYQEVYNKGKFQRLINEKITLRPSNAAAEDKISFDSGLNITDDADIRNAIEVVGLTLVNNSKWKSVIVYHKKGSGNVAATPLYNLILGLAHYYDGNMYDSLKFLKDAERKKDDLSPDMKNHLIYFYAAVRYFFGMITEAGFEEIMSKLETEQNIGLYVKLEKAKKDFLDKMDREALVQYKKSVEEIINSPNADQHVVLNAKREMLLYDGFNNNKEFVQQCCIAFAMENISFDKSATKEFVKETIQIHLRWAENIRELHNEALAKKDFFSYYNSILVEVKIKYQFLSSLKILFDTHEKTVTEMTPEMKDQIEALQEKIKSSVEYFTEVGHVENQAVSLSQQYEILHFSDNFGKAQTVLNELERIIDIYDSRELRTKLEHLKNRGTQHESFIDFMKETSQRGKRNYEAVIDIHKELKKMDEDEQVGADTPRKGYLHIHLFPIGFFKFPKTEVENVLEVLNVDADAKEGFRQLFGMVIPIANILNDPIQCEGYANGKADDKGIKSWENIYRIRKYFYENKFYRFYAI